MTKDELKKILAQHSLWLKTFGKEGSQADLRNADLQMANLQGANLRKADLRKADLRKANLQNADLHGAYLRMADLRKANLRNANLQGANLRWANLRWTNLQGVDLLGAKNIEQAFLTEEQKQALGLKTGNTLQQQAEQNVEIKRLKQQLEKHKKDKKTDAESKQDLEEKLSKLQDIQAEKEAVEQEKKKLEEAALDRQSTSLKKVVEEISNATTTSKELLDTYKSQSKWLIDGSIVLYASAIVIGCAIYLYAHINPKETVTNWYLFAPTLLLSFVATALLRHDWKLRQLSETLVNHQNTTEMAAGILKASLLLQTIEGTSDHILEESFTDIRSVLLTGNNKNKQPKDDSNLEKTISNGIRAMK